MRRWTGFTRVFVLCLTTAAITTAASTASASIATASSRSTSHPPARSATSHAGGATAHASRVARVKPGSTWTLKIGSSCEGDSFASHHTFSDVAVKGDTGTYKGGGNLTMTWKTGPATGAVFKGTFVKANDDYVGPYTKAGLTQSATLVPAAAFGCDVLTTAPESNSIPLGTSDFDTATVGGQGAVTPTGTIHFYVCPGNTNPCTALSAGVVDLGAVALAGSGSSANALSSPYSPTAIGSYCFLGVYSGDSHYSPLSDGSTTDECFGVTPAGPAMTTSPVSASVSLGSADSDAATVGGSGGVTPTGTVHFYACKGNASPCTISHALNGGTDLGTAALSGSAGTASATSAPFTAGATGTYCFLGVYSGDADYGAASDSSTSDECFGVTSAAQGMTTAPSKSTDGQGQSISDIATVTGANGITPTGSVTFDVCGPETSPTAVPCTVATRSPVGSPVTLSGVGDTATATSAPYTPTATGLYCFDATYSGDGTYPSASDGSPSRECFNVVPLP